MSAVQLGGRKKIERGGEQADPGSTADRVKQEIVRRDPWVKKRDEKTKNKRSAEKKIGPGGETRNNFRMENADGERRQGEDKTDYGPGEADIEERSAAAHGSAYENEGAEGADERGGRNKVGIRSADVVVATSEPVTQLVGQKNAHEREGERQTGEKDPRRGEEGGKIVDEGVDGDGFVLLIRVGKLSACGKAGHQRGEKKACGKNERGQTRARRLGRER